MLKHLILSIIRWLFSTGENELLFHWFILIQLNLESCLANPDMLVIYFDLIEKFDSNLILHKMLI